MSGTGIAGTIDYHPATEHPGIRCHVCGVSIDNGGHAARALPHQTPGAAIVCSATCAADPTFSSPFKEVPMPEPETPHVRFCVNRWKRTMQFTYTNWRGNTEVRHVVPTEISHRATEYYPVPQWIMAGWDKDRQAQREFAMNQMWGQRWVDQRDGTADDPSFQVATAGAAETLPVTEPAHIGDASSEDVAIDSDVSAGGLD